MHLDEERDRLIETCDRLAARSGSRACRLVPFRPSWVTSRDTISARRGESESARVEPESGQFRDVHVGAGVRHLRGRGRLAVYLPDEVEPDGKAFRLYRAVARIATKSDAKIVPLFVGGSRHS